jgi:hypothetical protein
LGAMPLQYLEKGTALTGVDLWGSCSLKVHSAR